jgi:hypothetical protein
MIRPPSAGSVFLMAARKTTKRSGAGKAKRATSKRPGKKAAKKALPVKKTARASKPAPRKPVKRPVAKKAARPPKPAPRKVATRRPSVTLPELPEIEGYVRSLPPPVVPLVNRLRKLVRDAAPEAVELLDASGPAYDVNGLFARIETSGGVVRVRFMKADRLEAPAGMLSDDATVSVTTFEELRENVLSSLVRQAVLLNVREPGSGAV